MAFWWVSQNQTYREEHAGGYLWAPKRDKGGSTPFHWSTMTQVEPGDLIFCYVGQALMAVATAQTRAYDAPKPKEFASEVAGGWEEDGWRITADYEPLDPVVPIAPLVSQLAQLLPDSHAPLNRNGGGNQGYLFKLPAPAGRFLLDALGQHDPTVDDVSPRAPHLEENLDDVWKPRLPGRRGEGAGRGPSGVGRRSRQAKAIGDLAEALVKAWLEQTLPSDERTTVRWVAQEGEQPGWDIEYHSAQGLVAIEVKGTTSDVFPSIEITAREWEAARRLRRDYWLYLVTRVREAPRITSLNDPYGLFEDERLTAETVLWRLERKSKD